MKSVTVICPSREGDSQRYFLTRMLWHIENQTIFQDLDIEVLICVDFDQVQELSFGKNNVRVIKSKGKSQAMALNAGLQNASKDYIAFCEDDDYWHPRFLETVREGFRSTQLKFFSSNELEVDDNGKVVRINDFPTPSGWVFERSILGKKIKFNESYKWHLDNEFLGQLNQSKVPRGHLVEKGALKNLGESCFDREAILSLVRQSWGNARVIQHNHNIPLVFRHVHEGSGMHQIESESLAKKISLAEFDRLRQTYGIVPK
ncbi:MAG: glycosyltransferase family A protein [Paracoccaceae bacterium]